MYYVKKKKSSQPPKTKKGEGVLFLGFEFGDWLFLVNLCFFGLFVFGLFFNQNYCDDNKSQRKQ